MIHVTVRTSTSRLFLIALACAGLVPGILSVANAESAFQDALRQKQGIEHRLTKLVVGGTEQPLPAQPKITLTISADSVLGGNSGINSYFGGFTTDDVGRVHWNTPGFATTLMAGPENLMNLEQQFLGALQSTQRILVLGRGLIFETEDGTTRLEFEEVNQKLALENLLGKKLVLARMITGGKETPLPSAPALTLLASDGRVSGESAVNSYTGSYKLAPHGGIEFSKAFATTRMAGPPELMDLENSFLNALSSVERFHTTGGGLALFNEAKTVVLEFILK
jgi:heat shock protein HslJ